MRDAPRVLDPIPPRKGEGMGLGGSENGPMIGHTENGPARAPGLVIDIHFFFGIERMARRKHRASWI